MEFVFADNRAFRIIRTADVGIEPVSKTAIFEFGNCTRVSRYFARCSRDAFGQAIFGDWRRRVFATSDRDDHDAGCQQKATHVTASLKGSRYHSSDHSNAKFRTGSLSVTNPDQTLQSPAERECVDSPVHILNCTLTFRFRDRTSERRSPHSRAWLRE